MLALCVVLLAAWGALALWHQAPTPWRWPLIVAWVALALVTLAAPWLRQRRRIGLVAGAGLLALLAWWATLQPSHQRDWADDVARLLEARVDADRVVLRNVRNFDWHGEHDYSARWETREYDLSQLASADLILSYWMGPHIAHTLVSFGFDDGRQLVFSLEIRKERHESFSAIGGFFKAFETVLVAADEYDIVRVRTNARGEEVHLYRLAIGREALRELFLGYVEEAGRIRAKPLYYNTLTSNCTTIVYDVARRISPGLPLDPRLLLSGHFAEYAFDHGGLAAGHAYAELRAAGDITDRARHYHGGAAGFPAAIRAGVPGIDAGAVP